MPKVNVKKAEELQTKPELPTPVTTFEFDESSNELVVTARFSFDYPDEAVINRLGRTPTDEKGNPTGEPKPVTSRTYGKAKKVFAGVSDAEDNAMYVDFKLYAPSKEAEAEATTDDDEEKE